MSAPTNGRAAPIAAPVVVSDATSLAVVGLNGRQFRAFLREYKIPHAKVGRRTVAQLDRILAALDRLAGVEPASAPRPIWDPQETIRLAARPRAAR